MKTSLFLAVFALASAGTIGAGCGGGSASDACQHACDCTESCSPRDETSCEESAAAQQTLADKASCTSEFDDMTSCRAGATCNAGAIQEDCAAEEDALTKCIDDAGFGGKSSAGGGGGTTVETDPSDVCSQSIAHTKACGVGAVGSVGPGECTGQTACLYQCSLHLSCDAIRDVVYGKDSAGARAYKTCSAGCGE